MAQIIENSRSDLTLDSLSNVNGFNNAAEGVPYSLVKVNGVYEPVPSGSGLALNPAGGLELDNQGRIQIDTDPTETAITVNPLTFTGIINGKLTDVVDPTDDQDVATKAYVDNIVIEPEFFTFKPSSVRYEVNAESERDWILAGNNPFSSYSNPPWISSNGNIETDIKIIENRDVFVYAHNRTTSASTTLIGSISNEEIQHLHLNGGTFYSQVALTNRPNVANSNQISVFNFYEDGLANVQNEDGSFVFTGNGLYAREFRMNLVLVTGFVRLRFNTKAPNNPPQAVTTTVLLDGGTRTVESFDGTSHTVTVPEIRAGEMFEWMAVFPPQRNNTEGTPEGGTEGGLDGNVFIYMRKFSFNPTEFTLIGRAELTSSAANLVRNEIRMSSGALASHDLLSFGTIINTEPMSKNFTKDELEPYHRLHVNYPRMLGNVTIGIPSGIQLFQDFQLEILSELEGTIKFIAYNENELTRNATVNTLSDYELKVNTLSVPGEYRFYNQSGTIPVFKEIHRPPITTYASIDSDATILSTRGGQIFICTSVEPGVYTLSRPLNPWKESAVVIITPRAAVIGYFTWMDGEIEVSMLNPSNTSLENSAFDIKIIEI